MREGQNGIFTSEDAELEVQRLFRKSETMDWEPNKTHKFHLLIPPTVYPPRDDTELFARRLTSIGPGRGRKLLEIGCGSGALTILASSLGWKVSACDINPYAVAAAREGDAHSDDEAAARSRPRPRCLTGWRWRGWVQLLLLLLLLL